jgi:replicative DNA helicase
MTSLNERREPVDIVTLSGQLRARNSLDEVGGIEYLSRLASGVPSSANAAFYAREVKEASIRRRVIHEAGAIVDEAFKPEGDMESFLDSVETRILQVADYRIKQSYTLVSEVVQETLKLVEKLYDQKQPVTGVPTGFPDMDRKTAGFQPSDLIILAARPAMGKTALAMSIAQHVGVHEKKSVAVFSLEMSKEQLVMRMLCSEARVENSRVRSGHLMDRDFPKLVDAASRISEAPILLDDTPALTITELRAKCRRMHRDRPLSLVVVDYLQLMRSPAYSHSREQEISDISRSLKALAKELHVPVIALSQLNRSLESRPDKRPMMSDLRESGAIEQDADLICFIYRDEVYNPTTTTEKGVAEVIIAKQRSGPTGTVRLSFMGEYTRFESLDEAHDPPPDAGGATELDLSQLDDEPF